MVMSKIGDCDLLSADNAGYVWRNVAIVEQDFEPWLAAISPHTPRSRSELDILASCTPMVRFYVNE